MLLFGQTKVEVTCSTAILLERIWQTTHYGMSKFKSVGHSFIKSEIFFKDCCYFSPNPNNMAASTATALPNEKKSRKREIRFDS
jgi:hypothetical protein